MGIIIPLVLILLTCLVIWRACSGFEVASEYIGRNLSEGVRGGTINAISSSIPELFTTLIALFVLADRDGFSIGIGTTAGSALFNGMVIPAACILSVVGMVVAGVKVDSVNVSTKVLRRDGVALIICETILILLINGQSLHWWQGFLLMVLYFIYLAYMLISMKARVKIDPDDRDYEFSLDQIEQKPSGIIANICYWLSGGPLLDLERYFVRQKQERQIQQETWNGWPLLLASTAVIGVSCWGLVKACEWLGTGAGNEESSFYEIAGYQFQGLGMPAMFVAVIFASMATSVPDTVISIRDARDGDYDDAVANALGSNVFDICFALGFPLFLYTLIHGPIRMTAEVAEQSGELRLLLLVLTVVGFCIYYIGPRNTSGGVRAVELKRPKAAMLLALYLLFVAYIIARSQEVEMADHVTNALRSVLEWMPVLGIRCHP